jgi:hypothetical protein
MSEKYQFLLGALIPSVLVVMSWIYINTSLSRLEAGQDSANRRMDELVRGFHADMMSFQASILEATYQIRERLAVVETNQRS